MRSGPRSPPALHVRVSRSRPCRPRTPGHRSTIRTISAHTSSAFDRSVPRWSSRHCRSAPTSSIMTTRCGGSDSRVDALVAAVHLLTQQLDQLCDPTDLVVPDDDAGVRQRTERCERAGVDHVEVQVVGRVPLGGADGERREHGRRAGSFGAVDQQAAVGSGLPPADLSGAVDPAGRPRRTALLRRGDPW